MGTFIVIVERSKHLNLSMKIITASFGFQIQIRSIWKREVIKGFHFFYLNSNKTVSQLGTYILKNMINIRFAKNYFSLNG